MSAPESFPTVPAQPSPAGTEPGSAAPPCAAGLPLIPHAHQFARYHADYCHKYESGEICECGEKQHVETRVRDFFASHSAWWHWGRAGCAHCESLMAAAGLDPAALRDPDLACREIRRQCEAESAT